MLRRAPHGGGLLPCVTCSSLIDALCTWISQRFDSVFDYMCAFRCWAASAPAVARVLLKRCAAPAGLEPLFSGVHARRDDGQHSSTANDMCVAAAFMRSVTELNQMLAGSPFYCWNDTTQL